MSATRRARLAKYCFSSLGRPKSLTISAPETLKRSTMVVFIDEFKFIASRVTP